MISVNWSSQALEFWPFQWPVGEKHPQRKKRKPWWGSLNFKFFFHLIQMQIKLWTTTQWFVDYFNFLTLGSKRISKWLFCYFSRSFPPPRSRFDCNTILHHRGSLQSRTLGSPTLRGPWNPSGFLPINGAPEGFSSPLLHIFCWNLFDFIFKINWNKNVGFNFTLITVFKLFVTQ